MILLNSIVVALAGLGSVPVETPSSSSVEYLCYSTATPNYFECFDFQLVDRVLDCDSDNGANLLSGDVNGTFRIDWSSRPDATWFTFDAYNQREYRDVMIAGTFRKAIILYPNYDTTFSSNMESCNEFLF